MTTSTHINCPRCERQYPQGTEMFFTPAYELRVCDECLRDIHSAFTELFKAANALSEHYDRALNVGPMLNGPVLREVAKWRRLRKALTVSLEELAHNALSSADPA